MKVYHIYFSGVWLGGDAIVLDVSKEKALQQFIEYLIKERPSLHEKNLDLSLEDVERITYQEKAVHMIDDGDY